VAVGSFSGFGPHRPAWAMMRSEKQSALWTGSRGRSAEPRMAWLRSADGPSGTAGIVTPRAGVDAGLLRKRRPFAPLSISGGPGHGHKGRQETHGTASAC